ncbi:MAG: LamG-like jellyroll fold domain-containing protein [Verrucomicrobiia bacterium]
MTKQGLLKWSYWGDATGGDQIAGTAVQGLLDDPRYPASPDLVRPVYSFNSRDAFPDDSHENFGATMEGYITPKESGSYRFFIYSDDASQLFLSTDDTEANLVLIAEEPSCCNFFTEPAATYEEMTRTSNPIALTAGKSYFVRMIYKEGGGGDYGQVAWRKEGDATPAAKLAPIPADFLSAAVELPGPAPVPPASTTLLDFGFNEGSGTNTVDAANGLVGILGVGMGIDPSNVPVTVTNNPAGAANDRALSLNAGNATSQSALLVNDQIAPILAFATNAPFTIEAWVNREAGDARMYEGLAAYGRSYKFGLKNGEIEFTLYGIVDIDSGFVVPAGEWHHVAAVWTPGTGVEFFYDGASLKSIAETRVPRAYQNSVLTIGAENIGANAMANTFQGMIDRFRIHSAALTADQLDAVAATPAAVLGSTVVAYNFNQTTHPYPSQGTVARPAVPNSAPAWTNDTPTGQEGDYALSFAPGTQVIVADPDSRVQLDPADPDFTMQAWVNFQGNPATRQVFYYNNGPGGALSFSVFTNRTLFVTTLGVLDRDSTAKIPDDAAWHHIAVVHENGKEFRFYVDGALADTKAYTSGVNFTRTNEVFYIGSEPTFGLQYTGKLDRLKVTQGMLTPDQFDYPAVATPPSIVSAGAVGSAVGVVFDVAVDPATAANPAKYAVSGATVTSAKLIAPNYVLLGVSAVPTGAFTVTATGISSTFGDVMTAPSTVEAAAGSTIPAGLKAYWSFDGHLLDSADGFDGVARGSPDVAFADGVAGFGKALKLTGTNYVEIPGSSNALQFANSSLSIAGWFKVETFDKDWQALIAKGEGTNYRIARRGNAGSIAYAGGVGEGADDVPSVNDGAWHHFVAVTDATKSEFGTALYVDGVRHGVMADAAVLAAGTANLFIGENPEALNRQFKGEIDDIGLWNRVLAPEEIAILYKGGQGTPVSALPGVITPIPADRPYTIGLNFAADEYSGGKQGTLAPSSAAGAVPQANWNNLTGANGTSTNVIVADSDYETAVDTGVVVNWVSNGSWASTGRGEENNLLTGADRALMIGYLDTGNATTTSVTITNIPTELTGSGYDVYVYALGGVGGRGGAYRILDAATGAVLKDYVRVVSMTNSSTFVEAPIDAASTNYAAGNYMVFLDLTAPAIKIEATTDAGYGFSGTPRAPLNAVQLVGVASVGKLISIEFGADGLVITFTGQLQSADTVLGPWTNVEGASPLTVQPTGDAKFYRVQQ